MKYTILAIALIATPAAAQNMSGMGMWGAKQLQFEASLSPQSRARWKCFQDAPWTPSGNYYDKCLTEARKLSDKQRDIR